MTQEDKELLMRDLCARLPYNVKVKVECGDIPYAPTILSKLDIKRKVALFNFEVRIENCKPYLRPLSSMSEEEKEDLLITLLGKKDAKYFQVLPDGSIDNTDAAHQDLSNFNIHWINFDGVNTSTYIDWLNAHHFDYRNLIDKELALDCTGLHIYD